MSGSDKISRDTLLSQARFFRIAERDHGLTRKAISIDTGLSLATLASWSRDTAMPLHALNRFADAGYPDALLSILTDPGRREIVTPADGDLDALNRECAGFVHDKLQAEADGKVTPIERDRLDNRKARIAKLAAA